MIDIESPISLLCPHSLRLFWDPKSEESVGSDCSVEPMMNVNKMIPELAYQSSYSPKNWTEDEQKIERKDETELCGKKRTRRPKIFTVEDR